MVTSALQLLAPILLLNGIIEDQLTGMLMMALNVIAVGIGMVKDATSAVVPIISLSKQGAYACSLGITGTHWQLQPTRDFLARAGVIMLVQLIIVVLIIMGKVKKKIKRVRIKPPPPVWTLIKAPPPIVDLMAIVMKGHLLDHVVDIVLQVNPIIVAYVSTFTKLAAGWLASAEAREELDRQFQAVVEQTQERVSISTFISSFHRSACAHVFRICQPKFKQVAQALFDEATRQAIIVSETKRSIKSGDDPIAAANSVVDPEVIKQLTDLLGPIGPVLEDILKEGLKQLTTWLKKTGQKKISQAKARLEKLAAMEETGKLADVASGDAEDSPDFELSLSSEFDSIEDIEQFKIQFAADLSEAIGLEDASRINIRDVVAGSTNINLAFTPGSPSPRELISNVLGMFEKLPSELPGLLQDLMPDLPAIPDVEEVKTGLDAHVDTVLDPEMIEKLQGHMDLILPAMKVLDQQAVAKREKWISDAGVAQNIENATRLGTPALIKTPVSEFQKVGIIAAFDKLQPLLLDLDGKTQNAGKAQRIEPDDDRSTDMRRKFSRLGGDLVWNLARASVESEIEQKITDLNIPSKIARKRVHGLVMNEAEGIVRKQVRTEVGTAYSDLGAKLLDTGWGVEPEAGDELEEDEFAFLLPGGFRESKGERGKPSLNAIGGPGEVAAGLIDMSVMQKLEASLQELQPILAECEAKAAAKKDEWLAIDDNTLVLDNFLGVPNDFTGSVPIVVPLTKKQEKVKVKKTKKELKQQVKKEKKELKQQKNDQKKAPVQEQGQAESDLNLTDRVRGGTNKQNKKGKNQVKTVDESIPAIPIGAFQTAGLIALVDRLRPTLQGITDGLAAEHVRAVLASIDTPMAQQTDESEASEPLVGLRSTDMRRAAGQLLQEVIIQNARETVHPELDERLVALGLPSIIFRQVRQEVYGIAEDDLRHRVHEEMGVVFNKMAETLMPSGCTTEEEMSGEGAEIEEDEYGFLVREGGYKEYKESNGAKAAASITDMFEGSGINPTETVNNVLDADLLAELVDQVEEVTVYLDPYIEQSKNAKEEWLAGLKKKELKKKAKGKVSIEMPTYMFHQEGLAAAVRALQPRLQSITGHIADRLASIDVSLDLRSTDMRRGLSQLLQEMVVSKVTDEIFPELDDRVDGLNIPSVIVKDRIRTMAKTRAEAKVRKQSHKEVVKVFESIAASMAEAGCEDEPEDGPELEEDDYGFLMRDGGYKAYQRQHGVGLIDQIEDMRQAVTSLQEQIDLVSDASHGWRQIFDEIQPTGDNAVITYEEFRFKLHEKGMVLSDGQFETLVGRIDTDNDGAISYDEFTVFFMSEQNELSSEALGLGAEDLEETEESLERIDSVPVPKNEEELAHLETAIRANILFAHLDKASLHDIYDRLFETQFPAGSKIMMQGDDGDNFYVIDSGTCDVLIGGKLVATLHPGECFGELALMNSAPRNATIRAKNECRCWALDRENFRRIMASHSDTSKSLDIQAIWDEMDADDSGHLDEDEVRKVFDMMGKKLTPKMFQEAYAEMDTGGNGEVDYDEFTTWFQAQSLKDLGNFRHFEKSSDELAGLRKKMEKKATELSALTRLMVPELPGRLPDVPGMPGVPDVPGVSDAVGSAQDAVANLGIVIPSTEMVKNALLTVVEKFRQKLIEVGGIIGEKAEVITFGADLDLEQMVRSMSKLCQVQVISLAREKIVPILDERIEALGLPGCMIVKKVKSIVYEIAEKLLRKFMHTASKLAVQKLNAAISIPGCALEPQPEEVDGLDECGFLKSEGGYKAARFGLAAEPGGDPKLAQMINKIIDPAMVQMLKDQLGTVGDVLEAYLTEAGGKQLAWLQDVGEPALAEVKMIVEQQGDLADEEIPKGQSEKELLKAIVVPTADFHKSGFTAALEVLKPILFESGGMVADKAKEFLGDTVVLEMATPAFLRRCFDQLGQEFIIDKVSRLVFPEIAHRLEHLGLVGPLANKVKTMVFDLAEDTVRAQIHELVLSTYDKMEDKMRLPGCSIDEKILTKKESKLSAEDEFGFLLTEGGWKKERKKRRSDGVGPGGPMEAVQRVLEDVKDTLEELAGSAGETLSVYAEAAMAAHQKWMDETGNQVIEKAKKKKKLDKVLVPVDSFHNAGLLAALQLLKPQLIEFGGPLAIFAEKVVLVGSESVSKLRQSLDQLVQHFIFDKVQEFVYPILEQKIDELELPKLMVKMVKNKVRSNF
jgi:Ca2+-binding EF-hand superfamily protein